MIGSSFRRIGAALAALLVVSTAALVGTTPALAQFTSQREYAGTSGGSANAYTLTLGNYDTFRTGVPIRWLPHAANTTASTVNITPTGGSALGAKNIFKPSPAGVTALTGGELQVGQPVEMVYDGTRFVVTSSIDSSSSSQFLTPQGYLTPCKLATPVSGCTAGNWVPTGNVSAATVLYYEPINGNQIPIYNGSRMVVFQFTEAQMTLTLGSSNLANTLYDVCVWSNAGTPAIGTTVAWTTSTAGSGTRGTGAGTAEIARVQGIWVNAVTATVKNGASTDTVAANQCTIVGTILIDGTNGQVTFNRGDITGGTARWAAWNFYNRLPLKLVILEGGTWTYATNTFRASNGDASLLTKVVSGLQEEIVTARHVQYVGTPNSAGNTECDIGVGINVTNAASGLTGRLNVNGGGASSINVTAMVTAEASTVPAIGLNHFIPIENSPNSNTCSYTGGTQRFTADWRG